MLRRKMWLKLLIIINFKAIILKIRIKISLLSIITLKITLKVLNSNNNNKSKIFIKMPVFILIIILKINSNNNNKINFKKIICLNLLLILRILVSIIISKVQIILELVLLKEAVS